MVAEVRTDEQRNGAMVSGAGLWPTVRGSVTPVGPILETVKPLPIYERAGRGLFRVAQLGKRWLTASRPSVGQNG